jgi:hypothetical protein
MPRKSMAALSVVLPVGLEEVRRPQPPPEFGDEARHEWLAVVNRLPADWFPRETHAMLAQYCRHVVCASRIAQVIDRLEREQEGFDIDEYDRLLKMQEREGRTLSSLATRMRMTQQSTYDETKRKPIEKKAKPWAIPRGPEHSVD